MPTKYYRIYNADRLKIEDYLENKGIQIDLEDVWIASTCLVNNLILVTHNTKHFEKIEGLKVEDWVD